MTYSCSCCGNVYPRAHSRDNHEPYCYEQWFTVNYPDAEHYIYIFTFLFDGKQRYYIGQSINPESRIQRHCKAHEKTIYLGDDKVKAPIEDITPINGQIVDTANSPVEADAKERNVFVRMIREVGDESMVCGGH